MEERTTSLALLLIGPGTLLVFGIGFLWAWSIERRRHYLLVLTLACMLFVFGALTQIFYLPADTGLNAIISNLFYTSAVIAASEGLLMRSGKSMGVLADLTALAIFSVLIWYFFYIDRNLLARVYIQNFGFGLILLATSMRLTHLAQARTVDRLLFWILLAFAIHFFPRTLFTLGTAAPVGAKAFGQSIFWHALQLSLAVLGSGLALAILAAAVTDVIDGLRLERDVDPLTGVLNRRGFEDAYDRVIRRSDFPIVLILCDIDHFKRVNDTFGHSAGDDVLRTFGAILQRTAGKRDIVGRIGGEEFAIVIPEADEAPEFTSRLRRAIDAASFPLPDIAPAVTASFGVAVREDGEGREELFKRADAALYAAKNAGRNRVAFSFDESSGVDCC
ncbi:GGDEF domain-containing protein [Oryzicola mucosus]|uniref:diguanylate cyclase n=1 Tax=Oryzicola mucosus TaxID=2767425 RepID=A0A8J6Q587_9HYPH|nr:GGDEF domain-containing protein [Oryzicola mucosus]MBD0417200.1 GGDEF domain-containing protein [Oryzicola mucosus]